MCKSESNRRLLRSALPNLAPGYGDSAHDKAADRLARDMEPGFTPGPWEAWNSHSGTILRSWRVGERNSARGIVRPVCVVSNEDMERSGDEQAANARLIAAAPDLYAAVQELINCADSGRDFAELKRARAAIAKAGGK